MSAVKCPTCDSLLTDVALADGWCPECGKRIPAFARGALIPTRTDPPAASESDGMPAWLKWTALILVLIAAAVAGWMWSEVKHGKRTGTAAIFPVAFSIVLSVVTFAVWVAEKVRRRPPSS